MSNNEDVAPRVSESGAIEWAPATPLSLQAPISAMPVIGIGLEEHLMYSEMTEQLPEQVRELFHGAGAAGFGDVGKRLHEVGAVRLEAMDQACTAIQVISVAGPGAEHLKGEEAVKFAREYNNRIRAAMEASGAPQRFRAFAHLPMQEGEAAAQELERCVKELGFVGALINGMTNGKFLDEPEFAPILSAAERLDVPIYLHPAPPPAAVKDAYYFTNDYINERAAFMLSIAGWNWHQETGMHILRLCFAGTFDRHPKLKVVIGHHGEMLPMMMHRADGMGKQLGLKRSVSDILRSQVWITISGMFSLPPLQCAIATFGADHVCWSVDYPFVGLAVEQAKQFVKSMFDTISSRDVHSILHGNAKKLLKL